MTTKDCTNIVMAGNKAYLYGVNLQGIHPVQDFLFEPITDSKLHIIYTGSKSFDPIYIVVAEKIGSTYSLNVKDAVKSKEFIGRLSDDDRSQLNMLAALNPPKRDYSKVIWRDIA